MRDRIPSDDEIQAAGVELGLIAEGQRVPARLRVKLARIINDAEKETASDQAAADSKADAQAVAAPLIALYTDLVEGGLTDLAAGRVLAALAPQIWRSLPRKAATNVQ